MLQKKMAEIGVGRIATLVGRYYAMDRDKRWERTQRAYELLVHGQGERATDPVSAIKRAYERGLTDEFIEPIVIVDVNVEPVATIKDEDAVIFFNFRPDRARQLTRALAVAGFNEFPVVVQANNSFRLFHALRSNLSAPHSVWPPRAPKCPG